jgi:hypothetical protein
MSLINTDSTVTNAETSQEISPFGFCLGKNAKLQAKRNLMFKKQTISKNHLKGVPKSHRLHNCLTACRDKQALNVSIMSNCDQKCNYTGLQTCGSRSSCIICNARLSEISRQDILKASKQHLDAGGGFSLLTFTIPHNLKDRLAYLIDLQTKARNKFNEHGTVKSIFREMGRFGYVRAFEEKHGSNGWHVHQHFLFYLEKPITEKQRLSYQIRLLKLWQDCCVAVGLPKPNEHGLDFMSCTDPLKASEYVVKDSFEMTYSDTKTSKTGSINAFDLLSYEPYQYGSRKALWREYYLATKGKARIYWSRGLKGRFGIKTKDDDEQAIDEYNEQEYTIPVVDISIFHWQEVKKYDLRAELLTYTEDYLRDNELINIPHYDEYINLFFSIFNLDIQNKQTLEPLPDYLYSQFDVNNSRLFDEKYICNKRQRPAYFRC